MKPLRLMFLLLLLLPTGCSPVREQLVAWQGARLDELIDRVGPPSSVSSDIAGNKLYHWYEDRGRVYTYGGQVGLSCERTFGVDSRELITTITWTGNCIAVPDSPWQRNAPNED